MKKGQPGTLSTDDATKIGVRPAEGSYYTRRQRQGLLYFACSLDYTCKLFHIGCCMECCAREMLVILENQREADLMQITAGSLF